MTFEAQIEALTGLDLTASSSYVNHDERWSFRCY